MNFLAHLHLAESSPESMIGNLLPDFWRGRVDEGMNPEVLRGFYEHRFVDSFTDKHPRVRAGIIRLRPDWGKFSGVLIDIFYDHLLATEWERWHEGESLREFSTRVSETVRGHEDLMTWKLKEFFHSMRRRDILVSYSRLQGIAASLARVRKIVSLPTPPLHRAVGDLLQQERLFRSEFNDFFPELIENLENHRRHQIGKFPPSSTGPS